MKRPLGVLVAFGAICIGAQAADLPSKKPVLDLLVLAPAPAWSGFDAGVNVGGAAGNRGTGGVIGGGQFGYNYQVLPLFVAGLEADIQGSSMGARAGFVRIRAAFWRRRVAKRGLVWNGPRKRWDDGN